MDFSPENLTQLMIVLIALVAAWIVFKLITRIIFKIILPILIVLIGGYFAYQYYGPGNLIKDITSIYCEGSNVDEVKCECFVKPIIVDMESRLTAQQILDFENDPLKSTEELFVSYQNVKDEINSCFESKGESKSIVDDMLKDIKGLISGVQKNK
jgi:energy-coupling factor transporter transmembrane protein EcfT